MNKTRILMILPAVASLLVTSCTGLKKPDASASTVGPQSAKVSASATSTPAIQTAQQGPCTLPSVFTASADAQTITAADLTKQTGTFQLSGINLFSQSSAKTSLSAGVSIKVGSNGLRDTKIQNICNESTAANLYSETLPVVMTLHLPSLRITEIDAGAEGDLPATNPPTYASFIGDSQGKISLKNSFSDKGPPFISALSLNDWIAKLPNAPSISLLSDGSIEMRIHWTHKGITSSGYLHFQQQK